MLTVNTKKMTNKSIYRTREDRIIGGVSGGLAQHLKSDTSLIRILFIVLTILNGLGVILYALLWIILPEENGDRMFATPENDNQKINIKMNKKDNTNAKLWSSIMLIMFGFIFLIDEFFSSIDFRDIWPVFLIITGLIIIFNGLNYKSKKIIKNETEQ